MYLEVPAPLPDSLVYHPCKPVGPGTTDKSLARAYTKNVGCIGDYKTVVEGVRQYNEKVKQQNIKLKESSNAR